LEIPAPFQSVDVVAVLVLVPVYERILVPVFRKFTGMANGITPLQRMGIGLFFATLSMVSAALVESTRLQNSQYKIPMSILWLGPQYFLIGAGEVFSIIGLNEFFYEESPDAMRSLCLSFSLANNSAGNYLSSFIISLVPVFTTRCSFLLCLCSQPEVHYVHNFSAINFMP
jgi:peptide/histidine transporter 3/4